MIYRWWQTLFSIDGCRIPQTHAVFPARRLAVVAALLALLCLPASERDRAARCEDRTGSSPCVGGFEPRLALPPRR